MPLLKVVFFNPDDIRILRSHSSKHSVCNNSLLLISRHSLNVIIDSRGIFLNPTQYRVRSHTIYRCYNCQQLGCHLTKNCPNKTHCINCGLEHMHKNSSKTLSCINCIISNQLRKTVFDTAHILGFRMPFFRRAYSKERSRLNIDF